MDEEKWVTDEYMPTTDEYWSVALVTSGTDMIVASSFVGMGDIEEQERKHSASCIEIYMKKYDVTEQDAYDYFNKKVEDAWKDINRESLIIKEVPRPLIMRVINMTRTTNYLYKDGENFTHPGEEFIEHVKSLFIHRMDI
ncbi:Terpene synthase, metal-binding domain-containing protein [Cynara cardunculus var. scolymus]|uniref:Terpene synthase, metal-binding domain-containing protein n=1 Tax=Cynara cardunculus var. scolymus TaxID=59895 RepID=A0A103XPI2_CYNCS|nr:Terpene synthase, metal-binding domain-containing protein [Cynara cardunculus var. scolymus]